MNDLLSESSGRARNSHPVEGINNSAGADDFDPFFEDVESVKEGLADLEALYLRLQRSNEQSKTIHNGADVKRLRSRMEADVTTALKKAKAIKLRLEALNRSNAALQKLPGRGPGSSFYRTRTSVVNGLMKKLHDSMNRFNDLRLKAGLEYRETVQRRYYAVTGEYPDEKTLDHLIKTGESETFLRKAIGEQGRGQVMDAIMEVRERHDAIKEMERNLMELHQVFLDMVVLVESQGEVIDDIERQVNSATAFAEGGAEELEEARKLQKSTRKWACFGIAFLLLIVLVIVLSLHPWRK